MGGFTQVYLKDKSQRNILKQNQKLTEYNVAKRYRFYSEDDVKFEYDSFCKGLGAFPEFHFPKDKIKSYNDFKKYWNTKALGEIFCPTFGTLNFDCYFGRTSKRAMRNIGKYVANNIDEIEKTCGSFSTFIERGMTKEEQLLMNEKGLV